jgi:hypothetical protein
LAPFSSGIHQSTPEKRSIYIPEQDRNNLTIECINEDVNNETKVTTSMLILNYFDLFNGFYPDIVKYFRIIYIILLMSISCQKLSVCLSTFINTYQNLL